MKIVALIFAMLLSVTLFSQTREQRVLTIPLMGAWMVTYNPNTTNPPKTLLKRSPAPKTEEKAKPGVDTFKVTALRLAVTTNEYFPAAYDRTFSAVTKFFSGNRGLIFYQRSDLQEALIYTAYFLDLLSYTQYGGVNMEVLYIQGTDSVGRTLYVDGSKLINYRPK